MSLIALCIFIQRMIHQMVCFSLLLCCSLKLECEKLATEKTEIQRHYVMVRRTNANASSKNEAVPSPVNLSSAYSCLTTPTKN